MIGHDGAASGPKPRPGGAEPRLTSLDGEVHVWLLVDDGAIPSPLLAAYEDLLAPDERERRDRYRFEKSRREYLLTRALVRTTLSRYAPVAPTAWTFRENAYGRPEIADDAYGALRFNLSNTRGLIACAVALDRDVGVDVEDTERAGETVGIARQFFSAIEVAALFALPEEERRARFFAYWTLKEAYIKARGMGLALPLDQFSFLLDDGHDGAASGPKPRAGEAGARHDGAASGPKTRAGEAGAGSPIRIVFGPKIEDEPSAWQFVELAAPSPVHALAAAVRRGSGPDLRFVVRRAIPLLSPG